MRRNRAAGFAIITAIAILVMLAVLGAAIVTVTRTSAGSEALDVLGSKGYQAARAGIEWGAFQIRNPENTNAAPPGPFTAQYACPVAATNFAPGGLMAGFTVSVVCTQTGYAEFGNVVTIYRLVSTACNQPLGAAPGSCPSAASRFNYVERQVTATMETCRQSANGASC